MELEYSDDHLTETFGPIKTANGNQTIATGEKLFEVCAPEEEEEVDPSGKAPSDPGAKLDHGKPRVGLVLHGFCRALLAVSEVGTMGANKYSDNGWKEVEDGIERYTDAMYRHLMYEAAGEQHDPESEILHAAHTAWNALARLDLMLKEMGG